MGNEPPRLAWSKQEAAAILGVPAKQIDGLIARGELPATRIGRHIRISDSALRAFVGQAPTEGVR